MSLHSGMKFEVVPFGLTVTAFLFKGCEYFSLKGPYKTIWSISEIDAKCPIPLSIPINSFKLNNRSNNVLISKL